MRKKLKKHPSPITLRLTGEERQQLFAAAAGMTVSAYIRQCVFGKDVTKRKRRSYKPVADQEAMAQALSFLGSSRISNNLNQLAYQANTGALALDDETTAQIAEAYEHVTAIRAMLVRALGLSDKAKQ